MTNTLRDKKVIRDKVRVVPIEYRGQIERSNIEMI